MRLTDSCEPDRLFPLRLDFVDVDEFGEDGAGVVDHLVDCQREMGEGDLLAFNFAFKPSMMCFGRQVSTLKVAY